MRRLVFILNWQTPETNDAVVSAAALQLLRLIDDSPVEHEHRRTGFN